MLKLDNISVIYDNKLEAIENLSLEVEDGEFLGVIGLSGSGKSTLLKSINLLVNPTSGKISIDNIEITNMKFKDIKKIRRDIGFVFQNYNLIEQSSVLQNVLIGRLGYKSSYQSILGLFTKEDYKRASDALEIVELADKTFVRADRLSGGQKQRVAIAKILCQDPKIILADEPVSSLDRNTSKAIMNYFRLINEEKKKTIIINLHDVELARKYCSRIIGLKKGKIIFDGKAGDIDEGLLERIYDKG